jgi:predicted O-methyltransferase YrrM
MPFLGDRIKAYEDLVLDSRACGYKPGHFYSPIPSREEIKSRADTIFSNTELLDINLNVDKQFQLLETFKSMRSDFPYDFLNAKENEVLRYRFTNRPQYRYSDVVFLYHVIRQLEPEKIVEVGSGSSSAVMLDINDLFFSSSIKLTFIEPDPERLYRYLKGQDHNHTSIVTEKVQDVPMDVFESLKENDILFIDSSHVSKVGSDVNHIFFNILPRINRGVWIHFHDIFYPFELPMHWVLRGRFWNESYLLRAFLMNNNAYEIMLFNTLLHKEFRSWFEKEMPECLIDESDTGSIWIKKT